eukprot:g58.t1
MRKKLEQSWIQGLKANGTKVSRDVYKTLMRASKSDIRSMEEWFGIPSSCDTGGVPPELSKKRAPAEPIRGG